jgi:hypothetical protein
MNEIRTYVCEVCGRQEADHSGWFLVAEDGSRDTLDVLPWDERVANQPGMCQVCCADHVQRLAASWMMPQTESHLQLSPPRRPPEPNLEEQGAAALLGELSINRAWIGGGAGEDQDSLLAILDAIEVVLRDPAGE